MTNPHVLDALASRNAILQFHALHIGTGIRTADLEAEYDQGLQHPHFRTIYELLGDSLEGGLKSEINDRDRVVDVYGIRAGFSYELMQHVGRVEALSRRRYAKLHGVAMLGMVGDERVQREAGVFRDAFIAARREALSGTTSTVARRHFYEVARRQQVNLGVKRMTPRHFEEHTLGASSQQIQQRTNKINEEIVAWRRKKGDKHITTEWLNNHRAQRDELFKQYMQATFSGAVDRRVHFKAWAVGKVKYVPGPKQDFGAQASQLEEHDATGLILAK
jgi:hypothetical protein